MGIGDTDSVSTETLSASVRAENQPVQLLYQGESHTGGGGVRDGDRGGAADGITCQTGSPQVSGHS